MIWMDSKLFKDAASTAMVVKRRVREDEHLLNTYRYQRKAIVSHIPRRTKENHEKILVRLVDVPAEILTEHIQVKL